MFCPFALSSSKHFAGIYTLSIIAFPKIPISFSLIFFNPKKPQSKRKKKKNKKKRPQKAIKGPDAPLYNETFTPIPRFCYNTTTSNLYVQYQYYYYKTKSLTFYLFIYLFYTCRELVTQNLKLRNFPRHRYFLFLFILHFILKSQMSVSQATPLSLASFFIFSHTSLCSSLKT